MKPPLHPDKYNLEINIFLLLLGFMLLTFGYSFIIKPGWLDGNV